MAKTSKRKYSEGSAAEVKKELHRLKKGVAESAPAAIPMTATSHKLAVEARLCTLRERVPFLGTQCDPTL